MSKEYIAAEMALFEEQCREVDIVITTVRLITFITTFCPEFNHRLSFLESQLQS